MVCPHEVRKTSCAVCSPHLGFAEYQRRAKRDGRTFALTPEQFEKIVNDRCTYCGQWPGRSIDRKDNRSGYTLNNVVPCCGECNFAKGRMSYHQFIAWINRVCSYQRELEQQRQQQRRNQEIQSEKENRAA